MLCCCLSKLPCLARCTASACGACVPAPLRLLRPLTPSSPPPPRHPSGLGTVVSGLICEPTDKDSIIVGVLQFLLAFFFIGWIWALVWSGVQVAKSSKSSSDGEAHATGGHPVAAPPAQGAYATTAP